MCRTMNKTRSRFLLGSFISARARMSSKPSSSSHYDTLEINSRATQGEIKSAYFKLSKQYHPDKNSSVEATKKFRDISEAYEVLGNYNSRKNYDRSIVTRTRYQERQQPSKEADPNMKYYQSRAAVFRDSKKSGTTPFYDFDAWTKAHYGKTLDRIKRDKAEGARKREEREQNSSQSIQGLDISFYCVAFVFITVLVSFRIRGSPYDEAALTFRDKKESEFLKEKTQ